MGAHSGDPKSITDSFPKVFRGRAAIGETEILPLVEGEPPPRKAWPVALIITIVVSLAVGIPAFLWFRSSAEAPITLGQYHATPEPAPTVYVTRTPKPLMRVKTLRPKPAPTTTVIMTAPAAPAPTVYVTRTAKPKPAPTVTKTIRVTPEPVRECWALDRRTGELLDQVQCP